MTPDRDDDLSTSCGRVRGELAGLVYDELAPDARAALEGHLAGCADCRDELAALADTRRLLARWETPPASEDPRALARSIAALAEGQAPRAGERAARRPRLVRWSALVLGAAAALLFTLSLLNARASLEGGRLQLDFALPGARSFAAVPAVNWPAANWHDEVRAIAAQEVALRSAGLEQSQEDLLQRYSLMTREELQRELLRLTQAVDFALAQKERSFDSRLETLTRETVRADLETRQALTQMASYLPAR
jgi:hypothetical protein